jgi:hypothetical protein
VASHSEYLAEDGTECSAAPFRGLCVQGKCEQVNVQRKICYLIFYEASAPVLDSLATKTLHCIALAGWILGLKQKPFFHFRKKQKYSKIRSLFAKFCFAKIFVFAKVFAKFSFSRNFSRKNKFSRNFSQKVCFFSYVFANIFVLSRPSTKNKFFSTDSR